MEEHFVCKVEGRLGGGPQDLQEARLLNRVILWAMEGLRCEADPRRAEQMLRGLIALASAKPVSFP
eukprot:15482028-Alexandrium_andersonii.AAC.1